MCRVIGEQYFAKRQSSTNTSTPTFAASRRHTDSARSRRDPAWNGDSEAYSASPCLSRSIADTSSDHTSAPSAMAALVEIRKFAGLLADSAGSIIGAQPCFRPVAATRIGRPPSVAD
jgi:hypothetical protein